MFKQGELACNIRLYSIELDARAARYTDPGLPEEGCPFCCPGERATRKIVTVSGHPDQRGGSDPSIIDLASPPLYLIQECRIVRVPHSVNGSKPVQTKVKSRPPGATANGLLCCRSGFPFQRLAHSRLSIPACRFPRFTCRRCQSSIARRQAGSSAPRSPRR